MVERFFQAADGAVRHPTRAIAAWKWRQAFSTVHTRLRQLAQFPGTLPHGFGLPLIFLSVPHLVLQQLRRMSCNMLRSRRSPTLTFAVSHKKKCTHFVDVERRHCFY